MTPGSRSAPCVEWLSFLLDLAEGADALALRWFRSRELRVDQKPDASPVTEADKAIEAMARRLVRERYPAWGVLGEEEGDVAGSAETLLIIDRKSTRLNSSHGYISYAVFFL